MTIPIQRTTETSVSPVSGSVATRQPVWPLPPHENAAFADPPITTAIKRHEMTKDFMADSSGLNSE